jgi:hypothetical protein
LLSVYVQSQSAAQLKDTALLESGVTKELTGGWLIGADPVRYELTPAWPATPGALLLVLARIAQDAPDHETEG